MKKIGQKFTQGMQSAWQAVKSAPSRIGRFFGKFTVRSAKQHTVSTAAQGPATKGKDLSSKFNKTASSTSTASTGPAISERRPSIVTQKSFKEKLPQVKQKSLSKNEATLEADRFRTEFKRAFYERLEAELGPNLANAVSHDVDKINTALEKLKPHQISELETKLKTSGSIPKTRDTKHLNIKIIKPLNEFLGDLVDATPNEIWTEDVMKAIIYLQGESRIHGTAEPY